MNIYRLNKDIKDYSIQEFGTYVYNRHQLKGYIAENQVQFLLDYPLSKCNHGISDDGYDIIINGFSVDVKTTDINDYNDPCWGIVWERQRKSDVYLFTRLGSDLIEVCGWLYGYEIEESCPFYAKGQPIIEYNNTIAYKDTKIIRRSILHPINFDEYIKHSEFKVI